MDREGFRGFLKERNLSADELEASISIAERFESFLGERGQPSGFESSGSIDAAGFVELMISEGINSYENFVALARYGLFVENNELYLTFFGLIDGGNVIDVIHEKLGESVGEEQRDEVFRGIDMPPLGMPSSQKPIVTRAVMKQMEAQVDPETCRKVLSDVAHGIPREYYKEEREKLLKAKNIDEYLEDKRRRAIAQLEKHRDEQTLFFNQEITDEVVDFVKSRPDMLTGAREGDKIIHTKIPFMTKEYLVETDERMKRYYACHCAWARETIKTGGPQISPTFCYCSGGFTKQPWEVALNQPLEVKMVKSALKGDIECRFIIQLPKDVVIGLEKG
ncbi:MAG: hypothetical protein JSW05_03630 [Candidatus Thorarchaeota archaeon]|nr:MAG: hypothetical protein JSW05_03630 [Candidatus Thorarchaeota archaeon]